MRIHPSLLLPSSTAAGLIFLSPALHAAAISWDAEGVDTNWSTQANWNPDDADVTGDDVTFGATGAAGSGTTNTVSANATINSLSFSFEDANNQHTTDIAAGQILAVTGNFLLASSPSATAKTNVVLTGNTGTFTVGGTIFQVGQTTPTSNTNTNSLDMSGLGTFTANLGTGGAFRLGSSVNGQFGALATVKLAAASSITAGDLGIGDKVGRGGTHALKLGSNTNAINANTISIGPGPVTGGRGNGDLSFETTTGTLTLRAANGTSAVNTMNLINTSFGTTANLTATANFSGHEIDAKIGTLNMGRRSNSNANSAAGATATFTFDAGTIEVGTLNLAVNAQAGSTSGTINAAMNIGGGTALFNAITMAASSASNATPNTIASLNLTGGITTLNGDIVKGGGTGTKTANLNLNGTSAVLDMTGDDITSLSSITYTDGLLKNLGIVNTGMALAGTGSRVFDQAAGISGAIQGAITGVGVGLTKQGSGSLSLFGANTYDGPTQIDGGLLVFGTKAAKAVGTATTAAAGIAGLGVHNSNAAYFSATEVADLFNTNTLAGFNLNPASGVAIDTTDSGGSFDQNVPLTASRVLTKSGTGTLILSQANSYDGGTELSGGVIAANHDNALGSQALTFSGGTRLVVGSGVTVANSIVIGPNSGVTGNGLIQVDGAVTSTVSGPITINSAAAAGAHFATTGGGILNLTGPITQAPGVSRVSQRTGTVVYSGGGTGVAELGVTGTARLGANNGIATTALVLIGASAAGAFDLAGFSQSVAGVTKGASAATIGNSSTTADSTLTTTGTYTYAGVIVDSIGGGDQKVALTVNGGALTLTGANTYTGDTTIMQGTLSVSAPNFADASTVSIGTLANPGVAFLNLPNAGNDNVAALIIDGVAQPLGQTYGNASSILPIIASSAITGPGTITVGPPATPYTLWAASFLPADVSNPAGDNDNDGLVNQQEFAFGLSPVSGSSVNPILVQLSKTNGTFTYQRRAGTGLTYRILTSMDLVAWPEDNAATAGQVAGAVDGNGNQTVLVTLTGSKPLAATKLFIRVSAE